MIAIVDSGGANIASVRFALERLRIEGQFTADPDIITRADKVILPGVGAAGDAMDTLRRKALIEALRSLTQPVLGICLGMQLLFEHSEEGDTDLLGLLPGTVRRLPERAGLRIPHMGWNTLTFVHSFAVQHDDGLSEITVAACEYGTEFTAIAARGNIMGCQFHPERSGAAGAQILKNFAEM